MPAAEPWLTSSPPEELTDGQVVLRRLDAGDENPVLDAVTSSHAELSPWMSWATAGYGRDDARRFLAVSAAQWDERSAFNYAVVDAGGALAGVCGLMVRIGEGGLEIGYWIRTDRTGRGLARRASALLADAALALPAVDRVEIHHDEANRRSSTIPRALGFDRVEVRDRAAEAPGESGRFVVWRRTR